MRKKLLIGIPAALVLGVLVVYNFFPGVVLRLAIWAERSSANLTHKQVQVKKITYHYLEGGKAGAPTVLMVHGYGGDKDNFTRFAKFITPDYHVISIDLPGYGESTRLENADFGIESQVSNLNTFAEAIGLKTFHIIGNSMGGHISASYTLNYADKVLSLGLLNAAGVKTPTPSEHAKSIAQGTNKLVVNSRADFDRLMNFVFVVRPPAPGVIIDFLAERAIKKRPFLEKVYGQIAYSRYNVESRLGEIKAATLVLWGDTDRVIDVSGARVFNEKIAGSKLVIMKNCGHVPMIERPEETASHYLAFLADKAKKS